MMSFRYAALALLVAAAPAMAQSLTAVSVERLPADYGQNPVAVFGDNSLAVPVDSVFFDDPATPFAFIFGVDFPGTAATPRDPGEFRAGRTVYVATFTNTRSTPFVVTGVRPSYRTSAVSAATSAPPRVQYDGEMPAMAVFTGLTAPEPDDDSLSAPGSIFQAELPLITRTVPSTIDGYPLPQYGSPLVSLVAAGATSVDPQFVLQPGQSITFRFQHFNVPRALVLKSSMTADGNGSHRIFSATVANPTGSYDPQDILLYGGPGVADVQGTDGLDDLFGNVHLISDNAFFPSAGEDGAANSAVALGQPFPNPAQGTVAVPFALRDAGMARLAVYDVTGRRVAVIADQSFSSGGQSVDFDTSRLAAGVYAIVLEANGQRSTQRLSVVR